MQLIDLDPSQPTPPPPTSTGTTPVQPASSTATGPYTTPIPNPTSYLQAQLLAKTAYENSLARLANQRSGLLRNAGYTANFDDKGNMSNLQVDQHNLYGGYQQMFRGFALDDENAQDNSLERGIYDSGLSHKALSRLRYTHGANAAQFGNSLMGSLSDLQTQQGDAFNQYNSALWQAQLLAAQQAIADQNFNPALDGSTGGTPSTGSLLNPDGTSPIIQAISNMGLFSGISSTQPKAAATTPARYYTYKAFVPLKPGQTVHYTPGKGYYAA